MTRGGGQTESSGERHQEFPGAVEVGVAYYLAVLFRYRRFVGTVIVAGCSSVLLVSFLMRPIYRAEACLVHAAHVARGSEMASLSMLSNAASWLGVDFSAGGSNFSALFPDVLRSRRLMTRVLEREYALDDGRICDLLSFLDPGGDDENARLDAALVKLRKTILKVDNDTQTGVTTVAAHLSDPVLAAGVANACVEELDRFCRNTINAHTARQTDFIRGRLAEVEQALVVSEEALMAFRQNNRSIVDSPLLLLEEGRLIRDAEMNKRIFLELKNQHEVTRIKQVKDVPLIMVLDEAYPPVRKYSPRRLRLLFSAFFVFAVIGIVVSVIRDYRDDKAIAPSV